MIEGIKTTQDMFDHVARHLFKQHIRSFSLRSCKYRGEHGLRCAVGCLIDDESYSDKIEGLRIDAIVRTVEVSIGRIISNSEIKLLMMLQRVHDNETVDNWPSRLKLIARYSGLKFSFTEDDWKECLV
jgi:hypothetical protein